MYLLILRKYKKFRKHFSYLQQNQNGALDLPPPVVNLCGVEGLAVLTTVSEPKKTNAWVRNVELPTLVYSLCYGCVPKGLSL